MRRKVSVVATVVFAGLAVCRPAAAIAPSPDPQNYQGIVNRNLFGLKDPPPALTNQVASPQLPKLFLAGITTILGNKLAFLKMQAPGTKAGEFGKEESLMLTEGQREGPVEVLHIDERTGAVRVNNSGTVTTLTFDKDLPKPVPSPGGTLSNTALATVGTTPFGTNPAGITRTFPTRGYRLPAPGGNPLGGALIPPGSGTTTASGTSTALMPTAPGNVTPTVPSPVGQLTPEQQQVLRQIQEQIARENPPASQTPVAPTPLSAGGTPPGVMGAVPPPPNYIPPPRQ